MSVSTDQRWVEVVDGRVQLVGEPSDAAALHVALTAAALAADAPLGDGVQTWLDGCTSWPRWDPEATRLLIDVIADGGADSWRLLDQAGVLDATLPELVDQRAAEADEQQDDRIDRWAPLDRLELALEDPAVQVEHQRLEHPDRLGLAAVVVAATGDGPDAVAAARSLVRRLGLGPDAVAEVPLLVGERGVLAAGARRGETTESQALQVAAHVGTSERARALYLLALTTVPATDDDARLRLRALHDAVQDALEPGAGDEVSERHRAEAKALAPERAAERIDFAPRPYLLATEPAAVAAHAELAEALSWREKVRVRVAEGGTPWEWRIDVASKDREALLASVTRGLLEAGVEIVSAQVATWTDGVAIESFRVRSGHVPLMGELHDRVEQELRRSFASPPIPEAEVRFDGSVSPWRTLCLVEAPDHPGLLHELAVGLAGAGVRVHAAEVSTASGTAVDRFEITDRRGEKLGPEEQQRVVDAIHGGAEVPPRGLLRRARLARS